MRKGVVKIENYFDPLISTEFVLEKYELKDYEIDANKNGISVILYSQNRCCQFDLIPDTRCTFERMSELLNCHLHSVMQQTEDCSITDRSQNMYIYFKFAEEISEQFTGVMKAPSGQ